MPMQDDLPKRLPLVVLPANRDNTTAKDPKLINCYMEKGQNEGEFFVYKRPGYSQTSQPGGGAATGRGVYNWKGDIYTAAGTLLYKNNTSIGTIDTTNGVYRFSSTLGGTPRLVLGNGVKAYTYDGTTFAQITDVDFPAAFVKGWAYLDATTYVMTATAQLNGSDLNDPTSWNSLNTIIAQIEPDGGVATTKQLVYVVAMKQWTTEVFYDAANSSGSPLSPVQGAKVNYGCRSADSVQDIDGQICWISTTRGGSAQVIMLESLKAQPISTKPIERLLEGADYTTIYSWSLKREGHKFYVITSVGSNWTLAYDLIEGAWSQWTDTNGNYLPIVSSTYNSSAQAILQHASNGNLYIADSIYPTDAGSIITVDIYPPQFDAGIKARRKHLGRMSFVADRYPGSILQVRNNDYDYDAARWTNFRNVDLNAKEPQLNNCGTFYRRAYHLRHACPVPLRIAAVDLQLALGII